MSIEKARAHLDKWDAADKILEFKESSATVELAAQAVGCVPARIAKTLSFHRGAEVLLIVTAGDAKVDNKKYKEHFGEKARMLSADEVEPLIGHDIGGVCPFGIKDGVKVYLDISMKRFETVYPAAGSASSAVALSIAELEAYSEYDAWIDVCKGWKEAK